MTIREENQVVSLNMTIREENTECTIKYDNKRREYGVYH